jgi:hypothetical protein
MQHPDFTSQLVRDRQTRFRADAGRNRLARPTRGSDGRLSRAGRAPADPDQA